MTTKRLSIFLVVLQLSLLMSFAIASSSGGASILLGADGSAGAPTFSYAANTDRGAFNDTANTAIGWSVGGAQRLRLSAASCTSVGIPFISEAYFQAAASSFFGFLGRSKILSTSNGVLSLRDNAETAFTRLDFGGPTSSFPALGRSGTTLQTLLADNSAGCPFTISGPGAVNGETLTVSSATELLTLSTTVATTDTAANLLPANSLIIAVSTRITTTIGDPGNNWSVGVSGAGARFSATNTTLTSGTAQVGIAHTNGGVAASAGIMQTSAAPVRITCGTIATAGVVRVTAHYITLVAPTS